MTAEPIITDRDPGDEDPGDKDPAFEHCGVYGPGSGRLQCTLKKGHAGPHSATKHMTIYGWWGGAPKP